MFSELRHSFTQLWSSETFFFLPSFRDSRRLHLGHVFFPSDRGQFYFAPEREIKLLSRSSSLESDEPQETNVVQLYRSTRRAQHVFFFLFWRTKLPRVGVEDPSFTQKYFAAPKSPLYTVSARLRIPLSEGLSQNKFGAPLAGAFVTSIQ